MQITITMRDGEVLRYPPGKQLGELEALAIEYVPGFVIVTDGYGTEHSFPAENIRKIEKTPTPRGF